MTKDTASDRASDESVRTYLQETLEHLLAAGHSTYELVEFSIDKFGRKIVPYLNEFQEDIRESRVKIQSQAELAKTAVFGIRVTPEQREQMIREAAYLRAEQRDFATGNCDDDWFLAEQDVDALLAKQDGLLEKGRKNLESVSGVAKQELTEVQNAVRQWLKTKGAPVTKVG